MTHVPLWLLSASVHSHITGIDWLVIGIYFSILLCVAWWVVRQGKDSAADYFLAGRNLGLVDHWRFHFCLKYWVRTCGGTGGCRSHQRCSHGSL